mmetsp:Transcript_120442/g.269261  ORF Transcript_120442/g.269261 Transcript_120442/m.269261 type:complete len:436 (+) Transcript_120442:220-1527(+)
MTPTDGDIANELKGDGGVHPPVRPKSVHTVDWATLQCIRREICTREGRRGDDSMMTSEELAASWLRVAQTQQTRQGFGTLSARDKDFIEIRVSQSMREVDPQCSGQVDMDVWVHHMLLTRSSPPVMRAMLQMNRLLDAALQLCPAILVGLQHALEVAVAAAAVKDKSDCMSFGELVAVFGRTLWPFRPGVKGGEKQTKRRSDFSFKTPDEFIRNTVHGMEIDSCCEVPCGDFLALCLGRREWQVTLHLYDLSKGMASIVSPWLLREQLEGVWHSGLVVFGKEYYFGGDIYFDTPAATGFGIPRVAIPLGTTLRQRDELHSFIVEELKPTFTREAYDAARNNCNHFTDRVAMHLIGRHIPEDVLKQPELMLSTTLGRTLRPILTRVLGQYFEPKASAAEITLDGAWGPPRLLDKSVPGEERRPLIEEEIWGRTVVL